MQSTVQLGNFIGPILPLSLFLSSSHFLLPDKIFISNAAKSYKQKQIVNNN